MEELLDHLKTYHPFASPDCSPDQLIGSRGFTWEVISNA